MSIDITATLLSLLLILLIAQESFPRLGLSIIAVGIAAMIAVDKIGAFGERWLLYRLASEALEAEVQLFKHRAGPYSVQPDEASRLLVERTEALLQREAVRWNVLSRTGELSLERKLGP